MTRGAGRSAAGGVRVTFYTRAAAGGAWRQVAERTFGSARGCEEFVGSLDVSDEPSVLRALMVYRDEARTHEWLCDRAVSPRPARIDPTFGWSLDDKAAVWAAGRPWTDAWEACPSPDWLLIAANAARVDPLTRVRATAAAAQLAAAGDPPDREATAMLWVALAALDDPNPADAAGQLDRILAGPAPLASPALRAARAIAADRKSVV